MKKIIVTILILILLLFISGCKKVIYKESKLINGDSAEFDFNLNTDTEFYQIELQVRYDFGFHSALDKLTGEIFSPTGKQYTAWILLSAHGMRDAGSGLENLHFKDIKSEEGTFKLRIQKEPSQINLKKATLKIKK